MIESMRVRTFLMFLFFLFCGIYLLPNVATLPPNWWFHNRPLSYGLDIQGGAHLVYGVDVSGVLAERTERMARTLTSELKDRGVIVASAKANDKKDSIIITLNAPADSEKTVAFLRDNYAPILQIVRSEPTVVETRYFDTKMQEYRQQVIHQAIQVIRNRVDEFGVAEPVIAAQGTDRILVQLPGLTDAARAKELINKTARLVFRLVDEKGLAPDKLNEMITEAEKAGNFAIGKDGLSYAQYVKKLNEALKDKLPPNTALAFEKAENAKTMEAGKLPFLLRTDSDITGDLLEDASVGYDQFGAPDVKFRFNGEGARKFGELTGNNIGRRLAIVLDEVIYSAPVVQSRITTEGQISLGSRDYEQAQKEGQLIATALRAGALPAALEQLEERSVGPSLGADSVEKGKKAGFIGLALVSIFICYYYGIMGAVASITLGLNVVSLLAVLSALGATLSLPGIAGITLTVGMAVDANVIIFERIKEELARGMGMKLAIKDGFNHAWSSIFDANVTSAIAGAVLIYFGTGAVRGFGVTLIAGIATTMVTAVFVTHYMLDVIYSKKSTKA